MNFNIISIFPQIFEALNYGVLGKAKEKSIYTTQMVNPRNFASDLHQSVDDRPFGGGDGMILMPEPWAKAVDSVDGADLNIAFTAKGKKWSQALARDLVKYKNISLVCGRYGGFDHRFLNSKIDLEISMGEFILSGGEFPALQFIDSIVRLIPGVLGNSESAVVESFGEGHEIEAPQFTRPRLWRGMEVPEAYLSGNHKLIEETRDLLSKALSLKAGYEINASEDLEGLKSQLIKNIGEKGLESCGLSEFVKKGF